MQIGKILFWINVNLCVPVRRVAEWHGDAAHQHVRGPSCQVRKYLKKLFLTKSLLQDRPGHPDGSSPRGGSPAHESFIQAGHLTQTDVTKLQFHENKSEKSRSQCNRVRQSQVHDLDTGEFSAPPAREGKMPRSVKFIKGISPKNWLQSTSHSNSAPAAA